MKIFIFLQLVLYALVTVDCAKCKGKKKALADLEACEKEKDELSDEVDKLEEQVHDLSNKIKELESELSDCHEEAEKLKKEIVEQKPVARNCQDLLEAGKTTSGVYSVDPDGQGTFDVYCDQTTDGGGFALIQRRKDGSVDFYRDWDDYVNGFGDLCGEFWLGLEKIHRLTSQGGIELRVDLIDWDGNSAQAVYKGFRVAGEEDLYRMNLDSFAGGTAGDSLSYHNGMAFTTKDNDHDGWSENSCAVEYKGAWWYKTCHRSNLNGLYKEGGEHSTYADGINWHTWKGYYYSAKSSVMRIKPMVN